MLSHSTRPARPPALPRRPGARRLLELAEQSGGLFRAPRGLALPFGVMEQCLDGAPAIHREYLALLGRLPNTPTGELEALLQGLRKLVRALPVPDQIGTTVTAFFGRDARLAVRSTPTARTWNTWPAPACTNWS